MKMNVNETPSGKECCVTMSTVNITIIKWRVHILRTLSKEFIPYLVRLTCTRSCYYLQRRRPLVEFINDAEVPAPSIFLFCFHLTWRIVAFIKIIKTKRTNHFGNLLSSSLFSAIVHHNSLT